MRIGCLQFAPQLGDADNNLTRADAVLSKARPENLDLLVLPELAFSGYNFKSLAHISPYLEYSGSGISALWARTTALKYDCVVTVGYPEKIDISSKWPTSPEYYSSTITINKDGETVANYRKCFLYHTDESWALEGPDGFYEGEIPGLGSVAMGINMDINPYKYEAPWSAWEFAYHILHREANLAVLSMAWLTREDARSYSRRPKDPDMETLAYWVARLEPLIRVEGEDEIIVVFSNRCGAEGEAVYSGTSAVIGIQHGEVKLYGILGRGEKELLIVDTNKRPQAKLVHDKTVHTPERHKEEIPAESDVSRGSNSSRASRSSRTTNHSTSSSTVAINGSDNDDDSDQIASIGEVLAAVVPMSPVEPRNPHAFFSKVHTKSTELQPLVSTIEKKQDVSQKPRTFGMNGSSGNSREANGASDVEPDKPSPGIPFVGASSMKALEVATISKQILATSQEISSQETKRKLRSAMNAPVYNRPATPSLPQGPHEREERPDDIIAVFERPSSPKSRNASRNRQPQYQEEALSNHDLAGVEHELRRSISRNSNHSRSGSISDRLSQQRTHSRSGSISHHPCQTAGMVRGGNTTTHSISFRGQDREDAPKSAGKAGIKLPSKIEVVHDETDGGSGSDSESDDGMTKSGVPGMFGPPRPKSVGW